MEQSPPWEDVICSGGQEIPYLLWNLKVQYHVHNSLTLDTNHVPQTLTVLKLKLLALQ